MKYVKLQKTSGSVNNNKYYEMQQTSDTTFEVRFGRVGSSPQTRSYSMSQWHKKYSEKCRKGYQDVTEMQAVVVSEYAQTGDVDVDALFTHLQQYSNDSFESSYSGAASGVTQAQVDQAQAVLDTLSKVYSSGRLVGTSHVSVNEQLEILYTILPRNMKRVSDYLVKDLTELSNYEAFGNLLISEQSTLDNASVVATMAQDVKSTTLPDSLGISIELVEEGNEIDDILQKMQGDSSIFDAAFRVTKVEQRPRYLDVIERASDKTERQLWHGTRTENVLSIFNKSLLIRPSNAIHTGSLIGDGIYFSDHFNKSLGYTSRGRYSRNELGYLFLFDVHTGKQYVVSNRTSRHHGLNYDWIQREGGCDSTFMPGGAPYDGSWGKGVLLNNEMVVYRSDQCSMSYIVRVK